jgi:hypothetical protein
VGCFLFGKKKEQEKQPGEGLVEPAGSRA